MKREKAEALVEQFVIMRDKAPDSIASETPVVYRTLKYDGSLIPVGTRINWNGIVKKAATDLWDREELNPDNAPDSWADLDYIDGYRIIPESITVTLAFSMGEKGWWKDELYESIVDNNVYTPEQYAQNWKKVEV